MVTSWGRHVMLLLLLLAVVSNLVMATM
jgi:hypothetical protein